MVEKRMLRTLYSLYKIVEAGEKGYAVCAANIDNPGLKILFKAYAQQRAGFKAEILAEIERLDEDASPHSSLLSVVHRGRINIFSVLIIEPEKRERVILREIRVGEKAALSAYEKVLKQALPAELQELISKQFEQVRRVVEQIHLIWGKGGKHMVVHLFETEQVAEIALRELKQSGLATNDFQKMPVGEMELYQNKGTTILETVFSGAVGGALWGSLIGSLAGIGAGETSLWIPDIFRTSLGLWAWIALLGILGGTFVGAVLGLILGLGITEADKYLYDQTAKRGRIILKIVMDNAKTLEAGRILAKIDLDAQVATEPISVRSG